MNERRDCSVDLSPLTLFSNFRLQILFQFVTFCEKMARVMKLDEIADDVGLDVNGEALLARGEQLVKLEVEHHEAVSDRRKELSNGDLFFCALSSLCIVSSAKPYATTFSLARVNKTISLHSWFSCCKEIAYCRHVILVAVQPIIWYCGCHFR